MKNLKSLLTSLPEYTGISFDSREVKSGYIFVAIPGLNNNGHDFIQDAIDNGATVVVGEKDIKANIPYIKVEDSREALGIIASVWFGNPSQKLKIIGVTGTKGKTTTSHLIYHILSTTGHKTGLVSSIAAKIGDREMDTGFHVTNPDVISLHKFLHDMVQAKCEYAVIEVSSHGIDQKRIAGIKFEVGVLTNIAPEHLDYHKTFKEYKRVKMSFIDSAKFKVIAPSDTNLTILAGKFNNLNVEAAIRATEFLGINKTEALNSLKTFRLPEGRLEEIKGAKDFRVFVDFAHTPDSLLAALTYFRSQTTGKLIAVFGSAGERDPYKRPKMGKIACEIADVVILTAEDPRTEKATDIISQIKNGIKSKTVKVYEEPDRKNAIALAVKIAKKGDLIALLGKGHEKSINLDGIHETPWSDQKVVREYIKNLKK